MLFDVNRIRDFLPHRYPFLMIDRVTELEAGKSVTAYKNVTINEQVFQGHFPDYPVFPGVLIIEGLAQAGGVLAFVSLFGEEAECGNKIVYFMSIDKAKFRVPVTPGDRLVYHLETLKHKGNIWVLQGKAYVEDKLVAEAELKAMIADKDV